MRSVGKPPRRSEAATLAALERDLLLIRDRKDPRNESGNDQRIPLFAATGFDAWALIRAQASAFETLEERIFPYNSRSVGTAFRRACRELEIEDLHFHNLRHEGTSRLFEAGFTIEQVALVTGHKGWKMLRRYTHQTGGAAHLRPSHKSRPESCGRPNDLVTFLVRNASVARRRTMLRVGSATLPSAHVPVLLFAPFSLPRRCAIRTALPVVAMGYVRQAGGISGVADGGHRLGGLGGDAAKRV